LEFKDLSDMLEILPVYPRSPRDSDCCSDAADLGEPFYPESPMVLSPAEGRRPCSALAFDRVVDCRAVQPLGCGLGATWRLSTPVADVERPAAGADSVAILDSLCFTPRSRCGAADTTNIRRRWRPQVGSPESLQKDKLRSTSNDPEQARVSLRVTPVRRPPEHGTPCSRHRLELAPQLQRKAVSASVMPSTPREPQHQEVVPNRTQTPSRGAGVQQVAATGVAASASATTTVRDTVGKAHWLATDKDVALNRTQTPSRRDSVQPVTVAGSAASASATTTVRDTVGKAQWLATDKDIVLNRTQTPSRRDGVQPVTVAGSAASASATTTVRDTVGKAHWLATDKDAPSRTQTPSRRDLCQTVGGATVSSATTVRQVGKGKAHWSTDKDATSRTQTPSRRDLCQTAPAMGATSAPVKAPIINAFTVGAPGGTVTPVARCSFVPKVPRRASTSSTPMGATRASAPDVPSSEAPGCNVCLMPRRNASSGCGGGGLATSAGIGKRSCGQGRMPFYRGVLFRRSNGCKHRSPKLSAL